MRLHKDAKSELLKSVPLFAGCSKTELQKIASLADELDLGEGATLIREGERGREFIVIADGTVRVTRNGTALTVAESTTAGVPQQTRETPGPYTRFTNMNVLFVQPQEGSWEVQLVDAAGMPVGPPALFVLSPDEVFRELYVRYKQR